MLRYLEEFKAQDMDALSLYTQKSISSFLGPGEILWNDHFEVVHGGLSSWSGYSWEMGNIYRQIM